MCNSLCTSHSLIHLYQVSSIFRLHDFRCSLRFCSQTDGSARLVVELVHCRYPDHFFLQPLQPLSFLYSEDGTSFAGHKHPTQARTTFHHHRTLQSITNYFRTITHQSQSLIHQLHLDNRMYFCITFKLTHSNSHKRSIFHTHKHYKIKIQTLLHLLYPPMPYSTTSSSFVGTDLRRRRSLSLRCSSFCFFSCRSLSASAAALTPEVLPALGR
jgi:hypothetical protein